MPITLIRLQISLIADAIDTLSVAFEPTTEDWLILLILRILLTTADSAVSCWISTDDDTLVVLQSSMLASLHGG